MYRVTQHRSLQETGWRHGRSARQSTDGTTAPIAPPQDSHDYDDPDFTAAELFDLLRLRAWDKCAVCGVELQAHFGIAKRPGGHFFCLKFGYLEEGN